MRTSKTVKVAELAPLIRKIVILKLAYIRSYRKLFGNHAGLRDLAIEEWLYQNHEKLVGASFQELYDTLHSSEHSHAIDFNRWVRSSVLEYLDRFDTTGVEKELQSYQKRIRKRLISKEMARVRKAVRTLQVRTYLPGFAKKYPRLKQALEEKS